MNQLTTSVEIYRLKAHSRETTGALLLAVISAVAAYLVFEYPPGWYALLFCAVLGFVLVTWYRPVAGVTAILGITLLTEQVNFADFVPFTRELQLYDNLSNITPFSGVLANALELLLVTVVVTVLVRVVIRRERRWKPNPLIGPILAFSGALIMWLVLGMMRGGEANIALWELRALMYFCMLAVLVPQIIENRSDVQLIMWTAILVIAFKAFQGLYNYAIVLRGDLAGVQAITGHEDALFFAFILVMLAGLVAYRASKGKLAVLAVSAPVIGFTFVATDRRVAYVALVIGMALFAAMLLTDKTKRKLVAVVGIPVAIAIVLVLAVGWNSDGAIGRPARALKSITNPSSTEDKQSNQYRKVEEFNLIVTIKQSPFVGIGFGRPYQMAGKLDKITFTLASFIPHNEIFWLWAKMGTIGFAVFWSMIGFVVAYSVAAFRTLKDPYYRVLAAAIGALVAMQTIVSYADLQLTFARNMVLLGVMVGVLARLSQLDDPVREVRRAFR
jgi:O-Antigen ligase